MTKFTKYTAPKDIIKALSPGACKVLLLLIQNNNLRGNNAIMFRNNSKPVPQCYIAETLGVSKSRISKIYSELENIGVIAKGQTNGKQCYYLNPAIATTKAELTIEDMKNMPIFKEKV
ncbi:hypothetical protein SAMN05216582_11911 [Selenomonas ruminantium]|uniref:Uncharacterized protein n=1 Tax=Selenomonas ruminantium TaxID=971 RepID=A0A1M6VK60_SELRU|nr:hypothetical protein [Selenomonas ruminantium]SHK81880.1 hypothetical protein SAMN05216582_11911 [Selenomonas ruminantium]